MKLRSIILSISVIITLFHTILLACAPQPPLKGVDDGTKTVYVGETVTFDGSGKYYCPDNGQITEYRWVLPPQAYCVEGNSTSELKCKLSPAGTYEVELQVKCSHGLWNTAHPNYPDQNRFVYNVTVQAVAGAWYVKPDGSDANNGQSWETAFRTIQMAIDSAIDWQTVIVDEGTYYEQIDFKGKSITVQSEDPEDWQVVQNTIIDAQMQGTAVVYRGNETSASQLKGFIIRNGAPESDSLALHLELDETGTATTAADSSGKARNGTLNNFPTDNKWVGGTQGNALSFDGTDDYVKIEGYKGVIGRGSRTCSAWIKTSGTMTTPYAVVSWGKDCDNNRKWVFGVHPSGKVCVYTHSNGIIGSAVVNDGNWHHIAAALESDDSPTLSDVKLYVDGVLQMVTFSGDSKAPINTGVGDFLVGAYDYEGTTSLGAWYKGDMDEVRIYSRALSGEEIQQQAASGPVAHWKLDDESGTQAEDSSGSDFHGTLMNFSSSPWTNGCIDGGLLFNGTSDYVMVAHDPVLNPQEFTISFWGRVDGNISDWRTPICARSYDGSNNTFGYNIYASNINKWSFWTGRGANGWDQLNGSTVELGRWTHIAASFLPTTGPDSNGTYTGIKRLYVDGIEVAVNLNGKYAVNATSPLTIGKPDWSGGYFNGGMDDVRIYDRALGATEIYELSHAVPAHWKLDGNCDDTVGNHDGTPYGSPVYENGIVGDAIYLNGTDQSISVSNDSALKPRLPVTLSSWVKLDAPNSTGVIILTDTWGTQFYGAYLRLVSNGTGKISIGYGDGTGSTDSDRRSKVGTTILQVGRWYHAVGVIRGALDMSIYINGVDDGGGYSGGGGNIAYSTGNLTIGSQNGTSAFYKGALDDVCIYNYALSKAAVQRLYRARFAEGGGIKGQDAAAGISNCVVSDSASETNGGGIANINGPISNCFITGNKSQNANGGGLANCNGSITNCVIAENSAVNAGAILGGSGGSITNCTIANNAANPMSGFVGGIKDYTGAITNTILWGNTDSGSSIQDAQINNCTGSVTYSCIESDTGVYSGTGNIDDDPLFMDTNFGDGIDFDGDDDILGTVDDGLKLQESSPCRDSGDNTTVANKNINTDIVGWDRKIDGDHDGTITVDMGAYENWSTIYVDAFVQTSGDGSSWLSPYKYLKEALSTGINGGFEIWVATGTYKPGQDATNPDGLPTATFAIPANTKLYGGFSGNEIIREERDWTNNVTILSGDISGSHVDHVLTMNDNSVIDGFTVIGGAADGGGNDSNGGGVLCVGIQNATIKNCSFLGNSATLGGAMYIESSSITVNNCVFSGNTASIGGAVYNKDSSVSILNATFSMNSASTSGGAICNDNADTSIINCILWSNTAISDPAIQNINASSTYINYSDIEGFSAAMGIDGGQNIDSDPLFVDADGPDNTAGTTDDDLSLSPLSPCLTGLGGENIGMNWPVDSLLIKSVSVSNPIDFSINSSGYIYVLTLNRYLLIYDLDLNLVGGPYSLAALSLSSPAGIAVDDSGHFIITDAGSGRVWIYFPEYSTYYYFTAGFNQPTGVSLDSDGNFYISDSGNSRIWKIWITEITFNPFVAHFAGYTWGSYGTGEGQLYYPMGTCVEGASGQMFLADRGNHRIQSVSADSGAFYSQVGKLGSNAGQFNSPRDVCYDTDRDQLVVADTGNNRIQIFQLNSYGDYSDNSMTFVKEIADRGLSSPSAVACVSDETSQFIYIADIGNNRILKIATPMYDPGHSPLHAFETYKGSLWRGDISTALTGVSDVSSDMYSEILYAIESNLQDFASGMGTMTLTSYEPGKVKYEMQHFDGLDTYSFPVIFTKDEDGNWRMLSL